MDRIGSSPFCWLEFDAQGNLVDANAISAAEAVLAQPGVEDLVVISHGWKNTRSDAWTLYSTLWANVEAALTSKDPAKIAVAGIVWPAKAYSTDFDDAAATASSGGTLAAGDSVETRDLTPDEFSALLAGVSDFFGPDGQALVDAATQAAQGIDYESAKALFDAAQAVANAAPGDSELVGNAQIFAPQDSPDAVLVSLSAPPSIQAAPGFGGTKGLGDAIGSLLQGPRAAVGRVLNQFTYFEMKKRAGIVGASLGSSVLPKLRTPPGLRLHLVGHSFGARLVTAAASALPDQRPFDFFSLTLLQGAFSHNALAAVVQPGVPGAFADVIGRPSGPISITHTHNDTACTFWYALASRLSQDISKGFGDATDPFGAMGANGAQKLAASVIVRDVSGPPFAPKRGKVNGFLADAYVVKTDSSDAHNNVTNPTCGKLVASVLQS
jgi:hypothetical protein